MQQRSLGTVNAGPQQGNVVLSEIHYAPPAASAGATLSTAEREFVEIWNHSNQPVDVSHWRLNKGVDFDISTGTVLGPQDRLTIVGFDPLGQPSKTAAFRQLYGIGDTVRLVGPWSGSLDNRGESLALEQPEDLALLGLGYVLVDRVNYDNSTPWPVVEAQGLSIHRAAAGAFGDFASSWTGASATPGAGLNTPRRGDFNGDGVLEFADIDRLSLAIRQASGDPRFDLNGDRTLGFADLETLIEGLLPTSFGDSNLDGIFNSSDMILVFQSGHYEDAIAGNSRWATGDWTGDGEFDSSDMVLAFQKGAYSSATEPAALRPRPRLSLLAGAVDTLFDGAPRHSPTHGYQRRP
jgi:hypothetical protein